MKWRFPAAQISNIHEHGTTRINFLFFICTISKIIETKIKRSWDHVSVRMPVESKGGLTGSCRRDWVPWEGAEFELYWDQPPGGASRACFHFDGVSVLLTITNIHDHTHIVTISSAGGIYIFHWWTHSLVDSDWDRRSQYFTLKIWTSHTHTHTVHAPILQINSRLINTSYIIITVHKHTV